nr:MAG TPA: hypothetical protein [Caudoviricetes sp.]
MADLFSKPIRICTLFLEILFLRVVFKLFVLLLWFVNPIKDPL